MRTGVVLAAVAAATAGLIGLAARSVAREAARLRALPDPIPRAELFADPPGAVTHTTRPDGTKLRVVDTGGDGPAVVLSHGYGVTAKTWNVVAHALAKKGFRVVTFDQRGHGGSTVGADGIATLPMAGDLVAVFDHAGVTDAVLVGHSMAGFLSIAALTELDGLASKLKGLILFASFAGDVGRNAPQNKVQIPLIKWGILQRIVSGDDVGALFAASILGDRPFPAAIDAFLSEFRAQDLARLTPILEAFEKEDRGPLLPRITVPTVVICGKADKTTPPWQTARLVEGIPGAREVLVEGAGHMLNWEAPDALVEAVVELSGKGGA
ncbi:Alpha/Beta hydrolase protein [Hyaloraphidium curvatum]|nr:Alpha/Beta hydrolase protein [Hyaloraphidium curvatum]